MAITDLSQYYQSIDQQLPSLSTRAGLYSNYGLGTGYQGTAQQNTALLNKLLAGGSTPSAGGSTPSAAAPASTSPASTSNLGQISPVNNATVAADYATANQQIAQPEEAALQSDLQAQLKQTLAAGNAQLSNQLSGSGFLRSGQQVTGDALAQTVAEGNLALQQAGYMNQIQTDTNTYAQTLVQNQVNNLGLNSSQVAQAMQNAQSEGDLVTNPDFTYLMTTYPQLAQQLLSAFGFNVTS